MAGLWRERKITAWNFYSLSNFWNRYALSYKYFVRIAKMEWSDNKCKLQWGLAININIKNTSDHTCIVFEIPALLHW